MNTSAADLIEKSPTGIEGLDDITRGGLPHGRVTLLAGAAGSGKTILGFQNLVNGARSYNEPGVFVAFEEHSSRIVKNLGSFAWGLPTLLPSKISILDAKFDPNMVVSGTFDLTGIMAQIAALVKKLGARRIVLDSVDAPLSLLENPSDWRRELYRLHEWLLAEGLTAIITAKSRTPGAGGMLLEPFAFLEYLADCSISLNHEIIDGVSQRHLRVHKYRGSTFSENQAPVVIGEQGIAVAGVRGAVGRKIKVSSERLSSGIARLDTMLGGGFFRGACVLITGSPGTAKTTLGGLFAAAACERGEQTLIFSFDSRPEEIVRNLTSVGIPLHRHVSKGLLHVESTRAGGSSADACLVQIMSLARRHGIRHLVVDPISSLGKQGNTGTAYGVVERLSDWAKVEGITLFCTSLLDGALENMESTALQISTIADTWIHLSYLVKGGERNRALTIVKSRGTGHSNQVRELVLSDAGVTLEDVYTAGGEVLMGTLRWERERAMTLEQERHRSEWLHQAIAMDAEESELTGRMKAIEQQLAGLRAKRESLAEGEDQHQQTQRQLHKALTKRRDGNGDDDGDGDGPRARADED